MTPSSRSFLVVLALLAAGAPLFAQVGPGAERPGVNVPTKVSSAKDLDRLEALKLYGQGLLQEKQHRLLEALKSYEQALRLDPDAATLHRAVIPIYLALDRTDEALAEFQRVAELDPADVQTQYLHARQLRGLNKTKEALAVLKKTAANEALKDHVELRAQVYYDAAALHEEAKEWADAEKALREVAAALDDPTTLNEDGSLNPADLKAQAAVTWPHRPVVPQVRPHRTGHRRLPTRSEERPRQRSTAVVQPRRATGKAGKVPRGVGTGR